MWSDWDEFAKDAIEKASVLGDDYLAKVEFELKEIIKQGANEYWIDIINAGEKFDHNKNGLVIPFMYGITDINPIKGTKKLYVNGENKKINGVEITLENGTVVKTSEHTMIKTERGYVAAKDLSEDDEVCLG